MPLKCTVFIRVEIQAVKVIESEVACGEPSEINFPLLVKWLKIRKSSERLHAQLQESVETTRSERCAAGWNVTFVTVLTR